MGGCDVVSNSPFLVEGGSSHVFVVLLHPNGLKERLITSGNNYDVGDNYDDYVGDLSEHQTSVNRVSSEYFETGGFIKAHVFE